MPKIYVHDFYFEDCDINNTPNEAYFCTSVNVYYNFSPDDPGDGWDNLEYFNITVASPYGLAQYLSDGISQKRFSQPFFLSYLLITTNYDKDVIMSKITNELQAITGKTEKELILKAIRRFSWESERIPEVFNKLF